MGKISEVAMILMAIDNLYLKCMNRKEKSILKYPISIEDPRNFNNFASRSKLKFLNIQISMPKNNLSLLSNTLRTSRRSLKRSIYLSLILRTTSFVKDKTMRSFENELNNYLTLDKGGRGNELSS